MRIPKVPHEVPVEKARKQATRKMMAGRKFIKEPASAGAQCDHVSHVSTQLPYVIVVAVISFITYIVAGFAQSAWISLPVGIILLLLTLCVIKNMNKE